MKLYYKESSEETPLVSLNPDKGVLIIDGNCNLEEPELFFDGISNWINKYSKKPYESTVLTINLASINISSSKFLLNIIYQLEKIHEKGNDVKIRWVYNNDEDGNFELGNDYAEMVSLPFEFIETVQNFMTSI